MNDATEHAFGLTDALAPTHSTNHPRPRSIAASSSTLDPDPATCSANRSQNRTFDAAGQLFVQFPKWIPWSINVCLRFTSQAEPTPTDPAGPIPAINQLTTARRKRDFANPIHLPDETTTHRFDPIGRRVCNDRTALGKSNDAVYGNHGQVFENINPLGETSRRSKPRIAGKRLNLANSNPPQAEGHVRYDADRKSNRGDGPPSVKAMVLRLRTTSVVKTNRHATHSSHDQQG